MEKVVVYLDPTLFKEAPHELRREIKFINLERPQQPRQAGIKRHSGLVAAGYSKKGSPGRPANAIRGERPGYSKGFPTP
jgi:hypothetical protein